MRKFEDLPPMTREEARIDVSFELYALSGVGVGVVAALAMVALTAYQGFKPFTDYVTVLVSLVQ